jgi:hypothetical protein
MRVREFFHTVWSQSMTNSFVGLFNSTPEALRRALYDCEDPTIIRNKQATFSTGICVSFCASEYVLNGEVFRKITMDPCITLSLGCCKYVREYC